MSERRRLENFLRTFGIREPFTRLRPTLFPFLLEILRAPELEDRELVLSLLAAIADGVGYLEVHARKESDVATWRSILAKRGTTLDAELKRERAIISAVRGAVEPGIDLLLPHLMTAELDRLEESAWVSASPKVYLDECCRCSMSPCRDSATSKDPG